MDHSPPILRQLRSIKWLLVFVALCFAAIFASCVWVSVVLSDELLDAKTETSLSEQGDDLLEQGKANAVLAMMDAREKTHPMDPNVFWYRGKAQYQLGQREAALASMRRVHTMAPDWRESHASPFIRSLEDEIEKARAP